MVQTLPFYHHMWPLFHFCMCFVNVQVVEKMVIIEQRMRVENRIRSWNTAIM